MCWAVLPIPFIEEMNKSGLLPQQCHQGHHLLKFMQFYHQFYLAFPIWGHIGAIFCRFGHFGATFCHFGLRLTEEGVEIWFGKKLPTWTGGRCCTELWWEYLPLEFHNMRKTLRTLRWHFAALRWHASRCLHCRVPWPCLLLNCHSPSYLVPSATAILAISASLNKCQSKKNSQHVCACVAFKADISLAQRRRRAGGGRQGILSNKSSSRFLRTISTAFIQKRMFKLISYLIEVSG